MKIKNKITSMFKYKKRNPKPQKLDKQTYNKNNIKKKRLLDLEDSTWTLVKTYASSKGLTVNDALEEVINKQLSWIKEILEHE